MRHALLGLAINLLGESKRVGVYAFTLCLLSALLVVCIQLEAPESVLVALAGAIAATASVGLPILINGVTKTDLGEAEAMRAPAQERAP